MARSQAFGQGYVPSVDTLTLSSGFAINSLVEISSGVGWTPSLDTVYDVPVVRITNLFSRGLICDCQLAGASSVDSIVLTTGPYVEFQFERRSSRQLLTSSNRKSHAVAREITAIGVERILWCRSFNRAW
jgi:hypothetical protein